MKAIVNVLEATENQINNSQWRVIRNIFKCTMTSPKEHNNFLASYKEKDIDEMPVLRRL
jgi:hypothetical protein